MEEQIMSHSKTRGGVVVLCVMVAGALGYLATRPTIAQEAGADLGDALARRMATQVVTLRVDSAKGEPRAVAGVARFDRRVEAYWVNVVGVDMQFTRNVEKQINRQMFKVDPIAKVINGRELEVTGMLGMRDGSGDWDDNYEGTITVSVTAILGNP
jgi:hypothetical protein